MVNFTNAQIDKAGRKLRKSESIYVRNDLALLDAIQFINDWRASHVFVICVFQMTLKRYAASVDKNAIVVQRLKKLQSIKLKLGYNPNMALSKMQDIGGCRVIVKSISEVYSIVEKYENSSIRHKLVKKNDYIAEVKKSGYRGVHLIYRYHSTKNKDKNGYFVEIQIRSKIQHYWATAVETAGIFTKTHLKSSDGDEYWKEFFVIASRLLESRENGGQPLEEDISKLAALDEKNKCLAKLSAFSISAKRINESISKNRQYLLLLNYKTRMLSVKVFETKNRKIAEEAEEAYKKYEKEEDIDAVLVFGTDIKELKKAYSNYVGDTKEFVKLIENILGIKRKDS